MQFAYPLTWQGYGRVVKAGVWLTNDQVQRLPTVNGLFFATHGFAPRLVPVTFQRGFQYRRLPIDLHVFFYVPLDRDRDQQVVDLQHAAVTFTTEEGRVCHVVRKATWVSDGGWPCPVKIC